jgi:hypothetical protein
MVVHPRAPAVPIATAAPAGRIRASRFPVLVAPSSTGPISRRPFKGGYIGMWQWAMNGECRTAGVHRKLVAAFVLLRHNAAIGRARCPSPRAHRRKKRARHIVEIVRKNASRCGHATGAYLNRLAFCESGNAELDFVGDDNAAALLSPLRVG